MCPSPLTSGTTLSCALQIETKAQGRQPKVQKNRCAQIPELCPSAGCWVEMVQVGKQEAQDVPDPGPSCMARLVSPYLSLRALQGPESACVGG